MQNKRNILKIDLMYMLLLAIAVVICVQFYSAINSPNVGSVEG